MTILIKKLELICVHHAVYRNNKLALSVMCQRKHCISCLHYYYTLTDVTVNNKQATNALYHPTKAKYSDDNVKYKPRAPAMYLPAMQYNNNI